MERGTFAIILSFIAVFFGIVAIITSRPCLSDFNSIGVIVAALCGLVTLLIAWNIYQVIDTRAIRQKYEEIETRLNNSLNSNAIEINQLRGIIFGTMAELLDTNYDRPAHAYEYYLYALRNHLFGRCDDSQITKILSRMEGLLPFGEKSEPFQDQEVFEKIFNEVTTSGLLKVEYIKKLFEFENQRKG